MPVQFELKIFETEEHEEFRVFDQNGEPWFVLVDVCRKLEIANPSDAAGRLDSDEKMTLALTEGHSGVRGGARQMTVVNESGLWSLVLRSNKPEAKRFKKWLTSKVIPSIRKTGSYSRGTPSFIARYNENWNRISAGHFSVLNEMVVHVFGRFENAGHILADKSPKGTENRMDNSAGRLFSDWLKKNHPSVCDQYTYYIHKTPEWEGPVRQYPMEMLHLFRQFLDDVWLPEHAPRYLKTRDVAALPYLQKVLPAPNAPKPIAREAIGRRY
ncbi:hypothetical protein LUX29_20420 [Aureimonas altamirensis]|uniref:BRO-N domain-containing protein n=1 Tax=Aureimonas altamirensis TaxID=370622 RepID=UPI001E4B7978|nr:BRO family protein [Aureimonas altamirensis]UHD45331.1 hypothetical protein LUX29_20420 [Aureimonas altamirensis]